MVFPCDLADVFLKAVKSNSDNNIETCGILLGSLVGGLGVGFGGWVGRVVWGDELDDGCRGGGWVGGVQRWWVGWRSAEVVGVVESVEI